VLAGTSTANFTVVTNSVLAKTSVQVSATANGGTKTGALTVTVNMPTLVAFTPGSVIGGASSTGKVAFGLAVASDTIVTLSILSGASGVVSMPATITVPAGSSSGTWTVITNPVPSTTTVQISASANGGSKTGTLTVKPSAPSGLVFTPNTVVGGSSSVGTVTFFQPVAVDTAVSLTVLTGSAAVSSIPASFTVLTGHTSGTFTLTTAPVGQLTTVQVSVSANGGGKTGSLAVK